MAELDGISKERFNSAVNSVDEVITEPSFVETLKAFTAKHCDVFEPTEENKLEYTPIFESYAKLVDEYVDQRLVEKGVDLQWFMKVLPDHMDSPDAHPRTGAVLELLSSFDDFHAFKDMMLQQKKARELEAAGGVGDDDHTKSLGDDMGALALIKDKLELTRILEEGGEAEGWTLIADKGWIQVGCSAPTAPRPCCRRVPRVRPVTPHGAILRARLARFRTHCTDLQEARPQLADQPHALLCHGERAGGYADGALHGPAHQDQVGRGRDAVRGARRGGLGARRVHRAADGEDAAHERAGDDLALDLGEGPP